MTNKLVVIINSFKIPKIKKILLEMKFLVPNYSCLQNPWLGGYRPQTPVLSVLCPQLNLLNPPWTKFLGTPLSKILRVELNTVHLYQHYSLFPPNKLQYTWRGDYCEGVRPAQLPVLTEVRASSLLEQHPRYVPHRDRSGFDSLLQGEFREKCDLVLPR